MELETRAPVRAHQGLRVEAGTVDEAGEGDRCTHGEQAALRRRRDQVVVGFVVGILVALRRFAVTLVQPRRRYDVSLVLPLGHVVAFVDDDGSQVDRDERHDGQALDRQADNCEAGHGQAFDRQADDRKADDRAEGDDQAGDAAQGDDRSQDDCAEDDCPQDDGPEDDGSQDDGSQDDGSQDGRSQDDGPQDDRSQDDGPQDDRSQDDGPQDGRDAREVDRPPHPDRPPGGREGRSRRDDGAEEACRREGRPRDRAQERHDHVEVAHEHEWSRNDVGPHGRSKGRSCDRSQFVVGVFVASHDTQSVMHRDVRAARS
jgi:hypothetical protein